MPSRARACAARRSALTPSMSCKLHVVWCALHQRCVPYAWHLPEGQRVQPDDQRVRRIQRSRDRRLPLPPTRHCGYNARPYRLMSYTIRYGMYRLGSLRRTRMHACTPERSCYCLLNGSVEFVSVDGMIGSMISACQSATVRLRAQSILSSKPPKQSTRGAEKHKSEAVRQRHKECL